MQLSICFFGSSRGGQRVAPKRHRKLDILKIMVLYCQGILFDLYGVLVDSIQAVERVWVAWALEMHSTFVTADQVSNGKPRLEPYLTGAKRVGFYAQDCVVFEDTAAGIQSAKAAGTKIVGLTTTYPASALNGANVILKDLSGIKVQLENGSLKLTLPE